MNPPSMGMPYHWAVLGVIITPELLALTHSQLVPCASVGQLNAEGNGKQPGRPLGANYSDTTNCQGKQWPCQPGGPRVRNSRALSRDGHADIQVSHGTADLG